MGRPDKGMKEDDWYVLALVSVAVLLVSIIMYGDTPPGRGVETYDEYECTIVVHDH